MFRTRLAPAEEYQHVIQQALSQVTARNVELWGQNCAWENRQRAWETTLSKFKKKYKNNLSWNAEKSKFHLTKLQLHSANKQRHWNNWREIESCCWDLRKPRRQNLGSSCMELYSYLHCNVYPWLCHSNRAFAETDKERCSDAEKII